MTTGLDLVPDAPPASPSAWKKTACILCSSTAASRCSSTGGRIARVRGDKAHPALAGLHLREGPRARPLPERPRPADGAAAPPPGRQLRGDRLGHRDPRGRRAAGAIRDTHGGDTIFYYGGGGQGNHLGGALRARDARGARLALHVERAGPGEDRRVLGRRPALRPHRCHTAPDFEHAEVAVFVGKNPWQSHGFPRARAVLNEIAKDPARTLIVIDPRRTETAELADFHLQVRPGHRRLLPGRAARGARRGGPASTTRSSRPRTTGADEVLAALSRRADRRLLRARRRRRVDCCARSRAASRRAASVSILEDLGIQQAPHSTLNSYLEKLLYLLTGNFAKPGAMNIHTQFGALIGARARDRRHAGRRHAHHHRADARAT